MNPYIGALLFLAFYVSSVESCMPDILQPATTTTTPTGLERCFGCINDNCMSCLLPCVTANPLCALCLLGCGTCVFPCLALIPTDPNIPDSTVNTISTNVTISDAIREEYRELVLKANEAKGIDTSGK